MPFTFHRHASWSSALALKRIDARMKWVSDRRAEIALKVESLNAEALELDAFVPELTRLREVEAAKLERVAGKAGPLVGATNASPHPGSLAPTNRDIDSTSPAIVRSAGEGASAARYDVERKVFLGPGGFTGGSTEPRRVAQPLPGKPDPLMDRAIKMIETPGLVHKMILAERMQEVIDVDSVSVPEEALGLPQSDAYRDHIFSSKAFDELSDPNKAHAFLRKLKATE